MEMRNGFFNIFPFHFARFGNIEMQIKLVPIPHAKEPTRKRAGEKQRKKNPIKTTVSCVGCVARGFPELDSEALSHATSPLKGAR